MSFYHEKQSQQSKPIHAAQERVPDCVQISLTDLVSKAREGLLALSVSIGLEVLSRMMADEVEAIVGPKGKHDAERQAFRHGYEPCTVTLGGRKIAIHRPRVRTKSGLEVALETLTLFKQEDMLNQTVLERMLHGLSTRDYPHGLEPCGREETAMDVSKSTVSRRFVLATREALEKLLERPLGGLDILVLYIDGVVLGGHTITVALGIDGLGNKHILGLAEGATENAAVCKSLLENLTERGLNADAGILAVLDGAKALRKAVKDFFGDKVLIQRCRVHKKRNVLDHLPEKKQDEVARKLDSAWHEKDIDSARRELESLVRELERDHPGAVKSLREGLEETLTVSRLCLPETLERSLRSTNVMESVFDTVGTLTRRVKRWQSGEQVQRWVGAGLLKAESRLRRLKGHRELCLLKMALRRELKLDAEATESKTA
jgi:putative transposase